MARRSGESKIKIGRGFLGGRVIRFTEQPDLRPTLSRVREAVFSMICDYAAFHGFIDLCAGSGIMGFQACSLGFQPVVILDTHPQIVGQLQKNAETLDVSPTIARASALKLDRLGLPTRPYLIYGDPPFQTEGFHQSMLTKLDSWPFIEKGSLYIAEQEGRQAPEAVGGFDLIKQKRYGRILITLYQK